MEKEIKDSIKEKKKIKIGLKTAIFLCVLIIALISCTAYLTYDYMNRRYINFEPIQPIENDIEDEEIANLINVNINEFRSFKKEFIGQNVIVEEEYFNPMEYNKKVFKNDAQENFKLLETYILISDKNLSKKLLDDLQNINLFTKSHVEETENNQLVKETLNRFYAYACSGLLKKHFKYNEIIIETKKIEKSKNYTTMYITINNEYNVIFEFNKTKCYFYIQKGNAYKTNKRELLKFQISSYKALSSEWNSKNNFVGDEKPIIYLYPTEESNVSVKLLNEELLTCTYPKYKDRWEVIAKPNGDLQDIKTGRNLYSLYYESNSGIEFKIQKDGFVVKGEDIIEFLEEKLAVLGLTEREAEEFIVYWLPRMESNKYNYVRFATEEEINENMPLEINPKPDTTIRILMTFKALENPIKVEEQKLKTPQRKGFVAVEWGGTQIY